MSIFYSILFYYIHRKINYYYAILQFIFFIIMVILKIENKIALYMVQCAFYKYKFLKMEEKDMNMAEQCMRA